MISFSKTEQLHFEWVKVNEIHVKKVILDCRDVNFSEDLLKQNQRLLPHGYRWYQKEEHCPPPL